MMQARFHVGVLVECAKLGPGTPCGLPGPYERKALLVVRRDAHTPVMAACAASPGCPCPHPWAEPQSLRAPSGVWAGRSLLCIALGESEVFRMPFNSSLTRGQHSRVHFTTWDLSCSVLTS